MKSKLSKIALLALTAAFVLGTLSSCKKDIPDNKPAQQSPTVSIKDLKAPAGFNFETFKDLTVTVAVKNPTFTGERFKINIYNDVPATGDIISSGYTDVNNNYSVDIRVTADTKTLWIEKVGANGNRVAEEVSADKFINKEFKSSKNFDRKSGGSGMTCGSGCTNTVNNGSGSYNVNSGDIYCFTGTLNNVNINMNGGVVKVCGNGTISGLNLNNNAEAYILENTIITASNINTNGTSSIFKNWSDSLVISGSFSPNSNTCDNNGRMYVNGDLNINSNGTMRNYSYLKVQNNFNVNKNFTNYDKMIVGGTFNNNSSADFKNYCYLYVGDNLNQNGSFINYEYVKVINTFTDNSSGTTQLDDAAQVTCKNFMSNKEIKGTGSNTSSMKVSNTTTINSSGKLSGTLQLCDANGVETNNGTVQSPANIGCTNYIATSSCNTEGIGTPPIQDADNDGVQDSQDEYPNDPDRAFNSYYPSANTYASIAYEDLWPSRGDFDFNDMVINYRIKKVLNASNKVVEMYNKMYVRAVGASYKNGFGFQLDGVNASEVSNVTGYNLSQTYVTLGSNKTEAGVTKAVIIAFDSPEPIIHRTSGSMFNTIKANPTGTFDTLNVKVSFGTPLDQSKVTQAKFNPFIMVNGQRNKEVHLGNFANTSQANTSLFGTMDDASNPSGGVYYKTANGIPFAIEIGENFDYPVEKAEITSAYNNFAAWAISGGVTNTNWYKNLPGNRNSANIY